MGKAKVVEEEVPVDKKALKARGRARAWAGRVPKCPALARQLSSCRRRACARSPPSTRCSTRPTSALLRRAASPAAVVAPSEPRFPGRCCVRVLTPLASFLCVAAQDAKKAQKKEVKQALKALSLSHEPPAYVAENDADALLLTHCGMPVSKLSLLKVSYGESRSVSKADVFSKTKAAHRCVPARRADRVRAAPAGPVFYAKGPPATRC